jgi:hypothetical protein
MYLEHGDSTTNTMCFLKEKQAINDGKTIHHHQFLHKWWHKPHSWNALE